MRQTSFIYYIYLVVGFGITAGGLNAGSSWAESLPRDLAGHAMSDMSKRHSNGRRHQAYKKWKNTPRSGELVVDLITGVGTESGKRVYGRSPYNDVTHRQWCTLNLRQGDRALLGQSDAGSRSVQLGQFLGGGNSKHVFALDDDRALCIPFAINGQGDHDSIGRERMRRFYRERPRTGIAVHELDPAGKWAIVERVHGSLTGDAFMRGILKAWGGGSEHDSWQVRNFGSVKLTLSPASLTKERGLLSALREARLPRMRLFDLYYASPQTRSRYFSEARQFLLDERSNEWRQVDWE